MRPMRRCLAVVAAVAVLAGGCGGGSANSLQGPDEGKSTAGTAATADVGEPVTLGTYVGLAEGERRKVTLLSVELVGNHGLTLVGTVVQGPGREYAYIGALPGFPSKGTEDDRLPLPGAVVPDGDRDTRLRGLSIALGLRRDTPGRGYATGFAVRYEVDGETHRQEFKAGFTVCAVPGFVRGVGEAPPCETYAPDPD